jgi:hypothetical protein
MHSFFRFRFGFLLLASVFAGRLWADSASPRLENGLGAAIGFTADEKGDWRWTKLRLPSDAGADRDIADAGTEVTVNHAVVSLRPNWTLTDGDAGRLVFEQEVPDAALRVRRIFSFGPAANVLRIETWVQSTDGERELGRIFLLGLQVPGEEFHNTGDAPASFPVFGRALFGGIEHVTGEAHGEEDGFTFWQMPHLKVTGEWQKVAAVVVGWVAGDPRAIAPDESPVRAAFLSYLDTVRVIPDHIELHTNTWWTLPLPFSESDVLKDIKALRAGFFDRTGMFFDSYALDLGWSNTKSVWRVDAKRFPNELRTINAQLAELDCKLGLWFSPGSAYPEGLDNTWLKSQGYEVTPYVGRLANVACFALGTRYQQTATNSILDYAERYGLGHVKLDFMLHACPVATHGHVAGDESAYAIDAGLADTLDALRAARPGIALEPLTCGYPPSPWWTMHTPFVLGPNGDDVPYGRVPCPEWFESLITARDIAYRSRQESWIMPTQALETFDIVVQSAGDFQNMAVMAIGRGRWFISTYLKPELMKPTDWDFLAAMVRWERANQQYLGNAVMFGGKPEDREGYGYVFHNPDKEIFCARNPWIEANTLQLPAGIPTTEVRELRMIYPRRATLARLEPGAEMPRITLASYETVLLETVPAGETTEVTATPDVIAADVTAGAPTLTPQIVKNAAGLHFSWNGTVSVPAEASTELCVLVQGAPAVSNATGRISLGGRTASIRKATSEGQFGAAADGSPDHWTWWMVTLPAGQQSVQIDLDVAGQDSTVGVYLRGTVGTAGVDADESQGPAFPVFHADRVAWSQTLVAPISYGREAATEEPEDFTF